MEEFSKKVLLFCKLNILDLRKNFNLATEITEFTEKFLFFSVFPVSSVAKMN